MKEEFLEILSAYQGILHKVCLVYFRNPADREDNFQEIVYQLWKSFPRLKKRDSIGSWIYAVAINTSLSRVKYANRIEYHDTPPELQDSSDLFSEISMNEALNLLLEAIYELDEISRSVMLLYLEEKTYGEIAAITGISKSNVGVRINRAKAALTQHLKKYDHGK